MNILKFVGLYPGPRFESEGRREKRGETREEGQGRQRERNEQGIRKRGRTGEGKGKEKCREGVG
jgi:hypothetical protein